MNWAYMAGFIDGEGNIGIGSSRNYSFGPRICVAQSGERGKRVLENIQEFLNTQGISAKGPYSDTGSKLSTQIGWKITVSAKEDAKKCLRELLPYLQVKKTEAQDLLRMLLVFPAPGRNGYRSWEGRRAKV